MINYWPIATDHLGMSRKRKKQVQQQIPDRLLTELLKLKEGKINTISDMEDLLEELKSFVGQDGIDKLIVDLPPEDGKPKPCSRCGQLIPIRRKDVERTFESLSGSHTYHRHYHYCDHCQFGFYPRDNELGLPAEGDVTMKLEQRLVDFGVTEVYDECAERWSVHYPYRPFSENMFRRATDRLGTRLELSNEKVLQQELAKPAAKPEGRLYVTNDGSMLPKVGGDWKEAKVGVIFREEHWIRGKEVGRGQIGEARYVAVWGEQEEFRDKMRAALDVERWGKFEQVVWLGDGARGNWTLAEVLCPTAIQILDIGHAIENGVDCGKALLGEQDPLVTVWKERIEQLVGGGNVDALIAELMECFDEATTEKQAEALTAIIRYYRNNQHRMNYPAFLAKGMMIGTGVVESAHRHVLQVRMKRSGQHWSEAGGRKMVRLRAAYRTAGAHKFHTAINRAACLTFTSKKHLLHRKATEQAQPALQKAA